MLRDKLMLVGMVLFVLAALAIAITVEVVKFLAFWKVAFS